MHYCHIRVSLFIGQFLVPLWNYAFASNFTLKLKTQFFSCNLNMRGYSIDQCSGGTKPPHIQANAITVHNEGRSITVD